MDEWDEFLSRTENYSSAPIMAVEDSVEMVDDSEIIEEASVSVNREDLGDFGDNAEVLMQMARGESLNSLSSNGVWINSANNNPVKYSSSSPSFINQPKKRSLKSIVEGSTPSVPIANSLQDLTRSIIGHPLLSHPLNLLKQSHPIPTSFPAREIDSLGLFFYGTAGEIKVESNVKDDMMKVIEMKKSLLEQSIMNLESFIDKNIPPDTIPHDDLINMIVSHENLKLLSNSIPPNGKTSWIIPFTVSPTTQINLSLQSFQKSDPLSLFYEFCGKSVGERVKGMMELSEHVITFDNESKVLIQTESPAFNISVKFRGSSHIDPSTESTNFLFYRQSNYSIEIDFETLKTTAIKSFVPKFDQQNRLFLLLKALSAKLCKLPAGEYFLTHSANTPFIKIFEFNSETENNLLETILK